MAKIKDVFIDNPLLVIDHTEREDPYAIEKPKFVRLNRDSIGESLHQWKVQDTYFNPNPILD